MPIQHTRPSRTGTIPARDNKSIADPNWAKNQRQPLLDTPAVTTFVSALALPAGAPGAVVTPTFQPVSAIYDRYFMVGPTAVQFIRIPWDGIYDITIEFQYHDPAQVYEVQIYAQSATTSDTGFAAPVWNNLNQPNGSLFQMYIQNNVAAPKFGQFYNTIWRGIELHANDLIRLQAQQSGVGAANTFITFFDVRWAAPIPNNMINV